MNTTTIPKPRYWLGNAPTRCDCCQKRIETSFVDGLVKVGVRAGSWGKFCLRCHREIGVGVAPGIGQLYQRQDDGRWLKTEG